MLRAVWTWQFTAWTFLSCPSNEVDNEGNWFTLSLKDGDADSLTLGNGVWGVGKIWLCFY